MSLRLPCLLLLVVLPLVACSREGVPPLSAPTPPLDSQNTVVGRIVDLGTLGGPGSSALAVNERGEVVGWSATSSLEVHGFLWTESAGMEDLGPGVALDVNDQSVVLLRKAVGYELWSRGTGSRPTSLDLSYAVAHLNNKGDLAGQTPDGRAFIWKAASGVEILSGLGEGWSAAYALNDRGMIAGYAASDRLHGAFLWEPGVGARPIESHPGALMSRPVALNESGQVAGISFFSGSSYRAFRWSQAEGWMDVGPGIPAAINALGYVIGTADARTHGWSYAFFWTPDTGMTNLRWLAPRPLSSYANDMNDSGMIVGQSSRFDRGKTGVHGHATLWTVRSTSPSS